MLTKIITIATPLTDTNGLTECFDIVIFADYGKGTEPIRYFKHWPKNDLNEPDMMEDINMFCRNLIGSELVNTSDFNPDLVSIEHLRNPLKYREINSIIND